MRVASMVSALAVSLLLVGNIATAQDKAGREGRRFDIVVCDPPAFAKSKKDQAAGLRAYGRMARLAVLSRLSLSA